MPSPPSGPMSRKQMHFLFGDNANNCPYRAPGVWWGWSVSSTSPHLPCPPALLCLPHPPTCQHSLPASAGSLRSKTWTPGPTSTRTGRDAAFSSSWPGRDPAQPASRVFQEAPGLAGGRGLGRAERAECFAVPISGIGEIQHFLSSMPFLQKPGRANITLVRMPPGICPV